MPILCANSAGVMESAEHQLIQMLGEHAIVSIGIWTRTKPLSPHQNPPHNSAKDINGSEGRHSERNNPQITRCNDEQHTYTGEGARRAGEGAGIATAQQMASGSSRRICPVKINLPPGQGQGEGPHKSTDTPAGRGSGWCGEKLVFTHLSVGPGFEAKSAIPLPPGRGCPKGG